jgi:hypothetical protein
MIAGSYTQTLFKGELEVGTSSVTVSAGGTTTANIVSTESNPATVWQFGQFDGSPVGFLNAEYVPCYKPLMRKFTYSNIQQDRDNAVRRCVVVGIRRELTAAPS